MSIMIGVLCSDSGGSTFQILHLLFQFSWLCSSALSKDTSFDQSQQDFTIMIGCEIHLIGMNKKERFSAYVNITDSLCDIFD